MSQGKRNDPTVEPSEADYWYAAGFIDGEGCVTVRASTSPTAVNPSMYASVTISQADPYGSMLQWFADRWGGAIRKKFRRPSASPRERDAWEWCVVGQQAYRLLEGVRPMLKIKGPQADNALRLKQGRRQGMTGRNRSLSADEITLQADVLATARRLNLRGLQES